MTLSRLAAALAFCATALPALAATPCDSEHGKGFTDCDRYREAQLGARHRGLFVRHGRRLEIRLANGTKKIYRDIRDGDTQSEADSMHYTLARHFPRAGYSLIEVQYYEASTAILLDMKTGRETRVGGDVELSPDGRRFVAWNFDIEPWFADNFIAVYRITKAGLAREYDLQLEERRWGPTGVHWQDAAHIVFQRTSHGTDGMVSVPGMLTGAAGKSAGTRDWRLQED